MTSRRIGAVGSAAPPVSFIAWLVLLTLALAPTPTLAQAQSLTRYAATEPHMGVEFEIILYAENETAAKAAQRNAFDRIAALNRVLSDYAADSEAMRLASSAPHAEPVAVSADLWQILSLSDALARDSGGAFDVTIGPLTRLWRRARRQQELPAAEALRAAREAVGGDKLRLHRDSKQVQLTHPGMRLDFGGIAKGWAAEEALAALKKQGLHRALVRGSGDVALGDPPPDSPGWRVGIAPLDPNDPPREFVTLANVYISTSGDARQHLVVDGKRYSHVIDPRSGDPVSGRSSVTVIAPRGHLADGWATALSVLGPEKGFPLLEKQPGVSALMVVERDGREERFTSPRWQPTERTQPRDAAKDKE